MTQPATDILYEPERADLELATILAALSDPARLAMVAELNRRGEAICSSLAPAMPKSTRSHHLKVLREAGVTRTRLEGTERHVRLRHECLSKRFPGLLDSVLAAASRADSASTAK